MRKTTSLVAMLALCITASAKAQTGLSSPAPADVTAANAPPRWIRGTAIELMVLKEVNSRTAKAGDSVILRVNAPVRISGVIVIPVGAAAHAEVIAVSGTSAAGGKGQISLRLSSAETQWGSVRLFGTKGTQGASNTGGVVLGVLGFGLAGLLTKGGNATFKGGEIITGLIDEGVDPVGEPLQVPTSSPPPLSN
jgi:hypothetical protein